MRSERDLEKLAAGALAMSRGTMPIGVLAIDQGEADWFAQRLKGRHGNALVEIVRGQPGDELPWAARLGMQWDLAPTPGVAPAPVKRATRKAEEPKPAESAPGIENDYGY